MKHIKELGLLMVAVASLAGFASTALATELTAPKGAALGVGAKVAFQNNGAISVDGSVPWSCSKSTFNFEIGNAGGAGNTVEGQVTDLTFSECGVDTVSALKAGALIFHGTTKNGTGTVTSTGAEITVQIHRTILGFPVTTHCIYATSNTFIGTFVSSNHGSATPAYIDIGKSPIPEVSTDGACGNDAALTGKYTVTSSPHAYIDP